MKQIKNFFIKYYPEILSLLIPVIIMIIAATISDIYPFGEYSFAKYDGYYQYPGFTSYFRRVLLGQESLFFSFKGLLGYNFYATAIYYLFNPTNLLCVFFDNEHLLVYYSLLVYLRIALCGFTMCKYLRYKFKEKSNVFLVVFSIAYALMAYNVCYFFNYMYYDVVVLFPIVMIGLEKLIKEKECGLYIIFLTLSIVSNFYIGFMVCIFSLLYFIYNYILLEKKDFRIVKKFIISSLLCGLMCMVIILPEAYELFQGKVELYSQEMQTNYFSFNLNFLNIFYKSSPGSTALFDIKYGTVNIYCSLLVFILVIKYFFNTKISKKEKIVTGSFIAFFLLSISFNLIDYFWHLMQRPIWYPNRYIFTFSFFLITIAYRSFKLREHVKMTWFIKVIIIMVYIGLMVYPATQSVFNKEIAQGICFILSCMLITQYMLFTENKYAKPLIIGLFLIEVIINPIITFKQLSNSVSKEEYDLTIHQYSSAVDIFKNDGKDDIFYRAEFADNVSYNNPALFGYNGIAMFSSIRNGKVMSFFEKNFDYVTRDSASIVYNMKNPYMNSILGIKYMSGTDRDDYYDLLNIKHVPILRNNDSLGLGYMVNKSIYDFEFTEGVVYKNTKELVNSMQNNEEEIYIKLDNFSYHGTSRVYDESKQNYYIKRLNGNNDSYTIISGVIEEDGWIICDRRANFYTSAKISINGEDSQYYFNGNTTPPFVHKGDTYEIKFTSTIDYEAKYIDFFLYKYRTYKSFIDNMKSNLMEVTSLKNDAHFEAKVTSDNTKSVLFTSLPYDTGWTIKVDGKKVDYNSCYDAFICLDLKEGEHKLEFDYIPNYFILGLIISLSALITSIYFIRKNKE